MARSGRFAHAEQPQGPGREGENLWTGTRGAYRYREMVASWIAERRHFKNGVTPDFSTTGDYSDVAHYTQIIWRGSKAVGCALASNRAPTPPFQKGGLICLNPVRARPRRRAVRGRCG